MKDVTIYTDGSCHGNPGPGGYAAIVIMPDGSTREVHAGEWHTKNNRMELMAVIEGIKLIGEPANICIVTDSKYVANQVNRGNLKAFINNPGRKNADLWAKLYRLTMYYPPIFAKWIKGHSGNKMNQRCDALANNEATKIENESEIRIFTISQILRDATCTPEQIASRFYAGYPVKIVQKYYNQFFEKRADDARGMV